MDQSHSGLAVGNVLPEMKPLQEQPYQLLPQSGRYSLIHFWAAYDGESRSEHIAWSNHFAHTVSDKIAYRAVCLDLDKAVYEQTLLLDGIPTNQAGQCSPNPQVRLEIIDRYALSGSMHSYLVDERGVVLSVDPALEELKRFYLR